jgi:cyclopropane fatty-acyl-phospholipid synthase-like methyltransferase
MAGRVSGYHAAHLPEHPARALVWKVVAEHLAVWVPREAHVLEIGAGYCDWINNVVAARRVAADMWPETARYAAAGVESRILDVSRELSTFDPSSFDAVLASNILEHFEPAVATTVVDDIARVLKPGGRLIIVQPNFRYAARQYFDDYTHRSVFTDVSLPNLLRAHGFLIDHVQPRFLPYSMRNSRLPIQAWTVRAYLWSPVKPRAGQMLVVARKDEGTKSAGPR